MSIDRREIALRPASTTLLRIQQIGEAAASLLAPPTGARVNSWCRALPPRQEIARRLRHLLERIWRLKK